MALTRPNYNNLNSNVQVSNDPITLLNGGSVSDDDVGFLINRANGLIPNVALYFNEATSSFVTAYTNDSGMQNANIAVSSYAAITVGAVYTTNGLFWQGNGQPFASGGGGSNYGDANVVALLNGDITIGGNLTVNGNLSVFNREIVLSTEVVAGNLVANSGVASTDTTTGALVVQGGAGISGNLNVGNVIATGYYNADGSKFTSGNVLNSYGNTEVAAYLPTHAGNITAAAITTTGPVAPAQLILPPYGLGTLPIPSVLGSMIFVTDAPGGSTPAFFDGTKWRSVIDRSIILGLFEDGQDWGLVLDVPPTKFANLGLITQPATVFYNLGPV